MVYGDFAEYPAANCSGGWFGAWFIAFRIRVAEIVGFVLICVFNRSAGLRGMMAAGELKVRGVTASSNAAVVGAGAAVARAETICVVAALRSRARRCGGCC